MWVMRISDNVNAVEPGEPRMKYIGNIHANEPVGGQLLVYLIVHLLDNYGSDDRITRLIDTTDIYIMPSANPDGTEVAQEGRCNGTTGRFNANAVDIDAEFPSQFDSANLRKRSFMEDTNPTRPTSVATLRQLETEALMRWITTNKFVLSASFHGGNLLAVYPFDDSPNHQLGVVSPTPDDVLFKHLAQTYVSRHLQMNVREEGEGSEGGYRCPDKKQIGQDGMINGNEWFPVSGL